MSQFRQSIVPLKRQITELEFIVARADIKTWAAVQEIVRAGLASKAFQIGDQLVSDYTTEQRYDVMDHDTHTPVNPALTHTMPLLLHDIAAYGTIPFCPSQLLYYTNADLPAGSYKFTLDHGAYGGGIEQDGTYMFTTDVAIPADGGIRHSVVGTYKAGGYAKTDITAGKVIIYGGGDARAIVKEF